jgi:hypothetical protein
MLNERAALAGEVRKANVTRGRLLAKQDKLQRQLAAVETLLARSQVAESRVQASIDALDVTMALAHSLVEPTAGGEVCAWAGKYGKRGGLGEFIEGVLRNAAPEPVTTTVLINLASQHFGLSLPLPKDRRAFRKSVSSALTSLLKRQLIKPMHSRDEGSHGLWRWTGGQVTLAALQLRAQAERTRSALLLRPCEV